MLCSALLLLTVNILTAGLFFRLQPSYLPNETWDRWQHSILIALVPTHTARARDTLGRKLLTDFHPLAIAKMALPTASFRALGEQLLRAAKFPLPHGPQAETLIELENFLIQQGVRLTAPQATADATQYCPRCLAQFSAAAKSCEDCQGLPLTAFSADQDG
jgi:hypothetical protein